MEVEAVDEGKLSQILVPEGTEGVKVNTPIAVIAGDGETPSRLPVRARNRRPPRTGRRSRRHHRQRRRLPLRRRACAAAGRAGGRASKCRPAPSSSR